MDTKGHFRRRHLYGEGDADWVAVQGNGQLQGSSPGGLSGVVGAAVVRLLRVCLSSLRLVVLAGLVVRVVLLVLRQAHLRLVGVTV